MSVVPTRDVHLTELKECQFALYTPDAIRKLSVKHITTPLCFAPGGELLDSGPYDPALGPVERHGRCKTCGLDEDGCPGHFGHIDLPLPVFNPFLFDFMFKALKATCLNCYRLRLDTDVVEAHFAKLVLLRRGAVKRALEVNVTPPKNDAPLRGTSTPHGKGLTAAKEVLDSMTNAQIKNKPMSSNAHAFYTTAHTAFLTQLQKKSDCSHCGCISPGWTKQGTSKVLLSPLSAKAVGHNQDRGLWPKNPLTHEAVGLKSKQEEITQKEAMETLKRLWSRQHRILNFLGAGTHDGEDGYKVYFYEALPVAPNRYRPITFNEDRRTAHPQTRNLMRILNLALEIRSLGAKGAAPEEGEAANSPSATELSSKALKKWSELQNEVNGVIVGQRQYAEGDVASVRQILEKKEGLFRKHLMGKRVNFAARSTISPDINLGVGIPPDFAKILTFPEKVTEQNREELRRLILRGAHKHPGAVAVEDNDGFITELTFLNEEKRQQLAGRLHVDVADATVDDQFQREMNSTAIRTVYRHLRDGDALLTNRQPTLHKASLMAHKARVLQGERTIRFHYANCAAFNADFDGDEMNLHFPQDQLSRAEAYEIMHADHQYINTTNGAPLRGLIQDSIDAGVLMSMKDAFFKRAVYMSLLFGALDHVLGPGERIGGSDAAAPVTSSDMSTIVLQLPAVLKPVPLWTGKQVIGSVLATLSRGRPQITTSKKCKTPHDHLGDVEEGLALFRQGHFLTGVLDKAQYQSYGLIHACQELYGDSFAGTLLSSLSRLFVQFLQMKGFTCGIGDARLTKQAEKQRKKLLKTAEWRALNASAKMFDLFIDEEAEKRASTFQKEYARVGAKLAEAYRGDPSTPSLHDAFVKGPMHQLSSEVTRQSLPAGLAVPFRRNGLSVMTSSGAKGSLVNFSQISCLLGQQELEGRRVPRMMSGKTLPCFAPYDPGARAGGFIADRFLTGLRPPEYYFHCMAGREGLVDTSVKTASSGYLQRCLVKSMEALRIQYDGSVRDDTDGTIYQFYYGEDGLDVASSTYMYQFRFVAENAEAYRQKLQVKHGLKFSRKENLRDPEKDVRRHVKRREKFMQKGGSLQELKETLPVMSLYRPSLLGSMSEKLVDLSWDYRSHNPHWLLHDSDPAKLSPKDMDNLIKLKYMESLAAPGEAVGVLAAQSVGEPSTQMTLNTFHMAGRGEANVTLGIPRLREILMTASVSIKTPVMILPLNAGMGEASAKKLANQLCRISLGQCHRRLYTEEWPVAELDSVEWGRVCNVVMEFCPMEQYPKEMGISWEELEKCFRDVYVPKLHHAIRLEKRRMAKLERETAITQLGEEREATGGESEGRRGQDAKEDARPDDEEEEDAARRQYRGGRAEQTYDAPEDEDAEDLRAVDVLMQETEEAAESSPEKTATAGDAAAAGAVDAEDAPVRANRELLRCTCRVTFSFEEPKLSMLAVAARIAALTDFRSKPKIQQCYVVEGREGEPFSVQTDGVSFETAWEYADVIDVNQIRSNDIAAVLRTYGVEAARSTIIQECVSVFGAYGITVNPRHLGLIADYMTNLGGYRGCNYYGIRCNPAPLLKMSFERSTQFIQEAALHGDCDVLRSPASRLVFGLPPLVGTGCMDIVQQWPELDP